MGKFLKWFGIGLSGLLGAVIVGGALTILVAGLLYKAPSSELTAAGTPRETSRYLTMQDGTPIAVDVWLPKDLKAGEKVPVLIKGTPYWRAVEYTFLGKAFVTLGQFEISESDTSIFNERGYAVVTVDTRGTGASFGHQDIMFNDSEVRDFGEVIDWAARQSWSNGSVGAYGFSYRGMLAVNMASLARPALKAIAPSFDFTDLYLTSHPGGVFGEHFIKDWGSQTGELNRGKFPCGTICDLLIAGPKRADSDEYGTLIARAIAQHKTDYDVYACARFAPNRDSKICTSGKSLGDISELSRKAAIEKTGIPMFVIAGYFDDTSPAQALQRFQTFSNPQEMTLAAISHGGFMSTDPFAPTSAPADPRYAKQIGATADFFDRYLRDGRKPISKMLHYFVLNGGGWHDSNVWPPAGAKSTEWYFADDRRLSNAMPANGAGADSYKVDFSATTGPLTRYQSPVDLSKTSYPDRAAQDQKLLTYTSAPLASDLEIAGNPLAKLTLLSSAADGIVIVYLEDVSADGEVRYLTEGILRLAHRKLASGASATPSSDTLHSYLSADTAPMTPGKAESIEIQLSPIAILLHKGERIRVSIAGADNGNLERIPATGDATLNVEHNSSIELPVLTGN